ncbi:S8 family serine peptidase [Paenibacillus polysaccharolyticus]|uniref:S8 family serine peptidase n=1 Tax=Paenibacillus polysaccharolyticus TaxID=582692 RepID=UPI00203FEED8|nr:S8 family serine peptidase [Paenibacillus polysaccharolyticus]MCM3134249.1 S8 family serine peptidase [Paenibacillus polysaccharolyticus]
MKHYSKWLAIWLSVALILNGLSSSGVAVAASSNVPASSARDRDKVELIVKYKKNVVTTDVITDKQAKTKGKVGKLKRKKHLHDNAEVLEIGDTDKLSAVISTLQSDPNVESVQPNYKLSILATPTDERFEDEWGLKNSGQTVGFSQGIAGVDIKAVSAWSVTQGDPSVVVGVLDSGIDTSHPDLAEQIYTNPKEIAGNGVDDDGNGYVDDVQGWDFSHGDNSVYDSATEDKHGTHVAGIIAAKADNVGIIGVAPRVKILPLKIFSGTTGYTSDAIEAIEYAKQMGVKIMNVSFGGADDNEALRSAMADSGMLFLASAGNKGQDLSANPIYPAAFDLPNVISVAAVDNKGALSSFSNYGSEVGFAAPGEGILSTAPGGDYAYMSGTSMAAPYATGVAALLQSRFPDLNANGLAARMQSTVTPLQGLKGKVSSGGLLNAQGALEGTVESEPSPVTTPKPGTKVPSNNSVIETQAVTVSPALMEEIHYGEEGVNVATGNYSKQVTDMSVASPGFSVGITRSYNSKDTRSTSTMGRGWTFGFEGSLKDDTANNQLKIAKMPDGKSMVFVKNADGTYTANDSRSTLVKLGDNTHVLTTKDQYTYGFNSNGYLIWMKDRNQNTITIAVDTSGKVNGLTDSVGRKYSITYTGSLITSVTDPAGRKVGYGYDANNRLQTVTDPMGNVIARYEYDTSGFLNSVKDGAGNVLESVVYNHASGSATLDRATQYTDTNGNAQTFTYDTGNSRTTIKDSSGRVLVKWYDSAFYVIKSQDPEGKTATVEYYLDANNYNKYGEEKKITNRHGNVTLYARDASGNLTVTTNPDGSIFTNTFDDRNNLTSETDENGNKTYYIYDTSKTNLLKKVEPLNGTDAYSVTADPAPFAITTYTYYANGQPKTMKDPEGGVTSYTYDGQGNLKSKTDPDGNTASWEYNNISWQTATITPEGYRTDVTYNKNGQVVKTVQDQGQTSFTKYDAQGFKIQEVSPNQYSTSDDGTSDSPPSFDYRNNAVGYRYTYEPNGNLKTKTDPLGNITRYTYDFYGNQVSETLPNQSINLYQYDILNRLIRQSFKSDPASAPLVLKEYAYTILSKGQWQKTETEYLNDSERAVTNWTYDYANREVVVKFPDGNTRSTEYNLSGTVSSQTDARGNTVYYRYDGLSRLTGTWLPLEGNQFKYQGLTYDRNGRKLSEITSKEAVGLYRIPLGDRTMWTSYTYEADGNVKSVTDSSGAKTLYRYDDDGRQIREDVYTSKDEAIITEYAYNELNKVTAKQLHVQNRDLVGKPVDDVRGTILETSYEYDAEGNLLSLRTPDGEQTVYTYDLMNRQLSEQEQNVDETGKPVLMKSSKTYDWAGNVLSTTDPRGTVTTYEYDERNRLVKTIDGLGNTTLNGYDLAGRQIYIISPNAYDPAKPLAQMSRTEYTYDKMDRVLVVTEKFTEQKFDPSNKKRTSQWTEAVSRAYVYDENGNVIKELDGEGYKAGTGTNITGRAASGYGLIRTYNAANLVVTELDAVSKDRNLKFTKKYSYDGAGRNIAEIDADGVYNGTTYDDAGREIAITVSPSYTQPEVTVKTNTYDLAGRLVAVTDGNGNTVRTVYNAFGKARSTVSPGDDTIAENKVINQYDLRGDLIRSVDSTGTVGSYTYNKDGLVLSHTEQAVDGSDAITTKTSYDANGNPRFVTDGNGVTTEKVYDKLNRLNQSIITVTDAGGKARLQKTTFIYDKNGNKTSETDWLGNKTQFIYDAKNRLVETVDASGVSTEKVEYNASDKQIRSFDGLWGLTEYGYDRNNRLLSTTDPEGNMVLQSYNSFGYMDSKTDGNDQVTRYTYDMLGRLISVTNALGEKTSYTYDLAGNKLSQTDPRDLTTTFEYNVANLLIRKMDPGGRSGTAGKYEYNEGKTESYTYTPSGQMAAKQDRSGHVTRYVYDIHDRLLSKTVTGSDLETAAKDNVIRYTYDSNNNPLTMTDGSGTTSRTYDELNRVVTKSVPGFGSSTFLMDQTTGLTAGFVAEDTTDPKGNYTRRIHDKTGRLYQVIGSKNGAATTYTYDENGNRKSLTYPNGTKVDYSYYSNNLLRTLNNYQGAKLLDTYNYTYDAAGNQTSKTELLQGVDKGMTTFVYDALNRLSRVTEPSSKRTDYEYDASGNRISEKVTSGGSVTLTAYVYNEQNRLNTTTVVDVSGTKATTRYSYDNNGNMIHSAKEIIKQVDPQNPVTPSFGMFIDGQPADNPKTAQIQAGTAQMTYDGWNQLISTTSGGGLSTFQYNGDGLRVKKTTATGVMQYLYEYDKVVLEADGNGVQTARNLYGLNLIMRTVGTAGSYTYLYNGHADVTALVDNNGTVQASYDYDPFGNIISNTGGVKSPIGYSGYQYDEESGLYYLNARYYDPKIARFLTEDTYRGQDNDPLSLNLYTYVHNDPIMYSDPTGHWKQSDSKLNVQAKGSIIALTSAYYNATNKYEKAAISKAAEAIRNNPKSKETVVTPLQFNINTINSIVNKAVSQRGYVTASEWNKATNIAGITTKSNSGPYLPAKETGNQTKTTTTIGMTNMTVISYNSQETKKSGASLGFSYNVTSNQFKFAISAGAKEITLEKTLVLNKLIDQNKGKLTKDILKRAGIPYHGGLGNNVDSLQAVYNFSKKNMTAAEAERMYRDEVINPNLDMAFFSVVMMPGGGSRVGNQKTAYSTSLTQAERTAVQRSSGAKAAGSANGKGIGQGLKVPQGLTQAQFDKVSSMIREKVGHISDDIVIQGSRAKGTAKPTSDIDIAIRVSGEQFDELIQSSFSKVRPPNPGSAKEKTMFHAIETGKIQSGEAKLSKFREILQQELGMDVDISIIKKGGPFDNPPFIRIK